MRTLGMMAILLARARIAIVAAVYLVVRRRRPGESAGQGMHM